MKIFALFLCLFYGASFVNLTFGQDHANKRGRGKIVQFSGVVYNEETSEQVPFATLVNLSDGQEIHNSNHQGFFSFVAHEGDTIKLSSVGYDRKVIVVPTNKRTGSHITIAVEIKPHIIGLPEVTVYPWASIEEFNYAFMNLDMTDNGYLIAKRNLSYESLLAMARTMPRDADAIQTESYQQRHINMSNQNMNQRMNNPFLSPTRWAAFIQQLTKGDASRSSGQ